MSATEWLVVGLGSIQAAATLGALFYAWRTVHEARKAAEERRRDRLAERLDDLVHVASETRLALRNANRVMAEAR